jgi:rubredoxin
MAKSENPLPDRKQAAKASDRRLLSYQDSFVCPVCRHGEISAITLMDAFACNFCRHIFTANLKDQSIRVEDSSQPMSWRWNGTSWQSANSLDTDLTILIWLIGLALVILPPTLVGLSSYTFPPTPGSIWYWFPIIWVSLAFMSHLSFVSWVLAEHYQFPFYVTFKIRLRNLLGQR